MTSAQDARPCADSGEPSSEALAGEQEISLGGQGFAGDWTGLGIDDD